MEIRPVDLPELRAEALLYQSSHGDVMLRHWSDAAEAFRAPSEQLDGYREDSPHFSPRALWQGEIEALGRGEMFYISEAMTDLARTAAEGLPGFAIRADDLPSKSGFMVFAKPLRTGSALPTPTDLMITAVAWSTRLGFDGVFFTPYMQRRDFLTMLGDAIRGDHRDHLQVRIDNDFPTLICVPGGMRTVVFNGPDWSDRPVGPELIEAFPTVLSAFLLMRQEITATTDLAPDRAAAKRARRIGHEPKPVRVVELRRPKRAEGPGDGSREYHHSWIVRGHWRQQWYPKREVHRPVWIAPHIKGPEDAPLIGGEKVYAWKR